jgi:hypothetical protein
VIENACSNHGINEAKVLIEGDTFEETRSAQARTEAIIHARKLGLPRAGVSGESGPYPVDGEGNDCTLAAREGMRYRNEFRLSGGLG